MAAFKLFGGKAATTTAASSSRRVTRAWFDGAGGSAAENAARRKAAAKLPGFRGLRMLVGQALGGGATAVLLEHAGQSIGVQHRIDGVWQSVEVIERDPGAAMLTALKALAAPRAKSAKDVQEGEFVLVVKKSRRACRVTVRVTPKGEQILLLFGGELVTTAPSTEPSAANGLTKWLMPWRRPKAAVAEGIPRVTFEAGRGGNAEAARARLEQAMAAAGYQPACGLFGAAVKARACEVLLECSPKGVNAHGEVDGIWRPLQTLDRAIGDAVVEVLKTIAGLDPRDRRRVQAGQCQTVVEGKPWPCRVVSQGVPTGERVQVSLDYGRPKIKSLAETGMSDDQASRVNQLIALESGLIVVATPKRGGLSTLFDCIVASADRMLREFVLLEDAWNPRPEIQNVKPFRWDLAKQVSPIAVFELALREYPGAFVSCDLKDAELAVKLVDQAKQGKLVVIGIRGEDAADGIANLLALGIDKELVGRVLVGAIGGRLVRKLCPKCQEEYLPSIDVVTRLRIDPATSPTLRRAAQGGCAICTETGYLGRTGIFEIAAGRTLNAYVAKGADAKVLRQAAAKDGMRSLQQHGLAKVIEGTTSLEEVQWVFKKG